MPRLTECSNHRRNKINRRENSPHNKTDYDDHHELHLINSRAGREYFSKGHLSGPAYLSGLFVSQNLEYINSSEKKENANTDDEWKKCFQKCF